MHGKDPLHPDSIRDLSYGKGLPNSSSLLSDNDSLKGLDSLLLSLNDLHMDPDRITYIERSEVRPKLFSFNQLYCIHLTLLFQIRVPGFEGSWVQVFNF